MKCFARQKLRQHFGIHAACNQRVPSNYRQFLAAHTGLHNWRGLRLTFGFSVCVHTTPSSANATEIQNPTNETVNPMADARY